MHPTATHGTPAPLAAADATIRAALADAHSAALMATLVHLEGDTAVLDAWRPAPDLFGFDEDCLGEEARAALRERALGAIAAWRDAGSPPLAPPDAGTVRAIIDFIGGEPPPPGSHDLLVEELALGEDPRAVPLDDIDPARRAAFRVLIIGAGLSGILAAWRCRQAGLAYTVLERNASPGGTWHENTYPGCRVDSYNHVYAFSFLPYNDWPAYFSTRPDIARYAAHCIERFGIGERILCGRRVESAAWDEAAGVWRLRVAGPGGAVEWHEAEALITATGQLNVPKMPRIPGIERFAGPAFHSARWDHGVPLEGRRVAVIGTGASATQFVPEIAPRVGALSVFQRSPPWLMPTPLYHRPIPDGQRWLFRHLPFYERWYRLWTFRTQGVDGPLPYLRGDPAWSGGPGAVGAANAELRAALEQYIAGQLTDRPDLLASAIPAYPVGGKRPLRDCGAWLGALKRPNVRLVTAPIREVTPGGLVTGDGESHAADVLVYGTGFRADDFLSGIEVLGTAGASLAGTWAGTPRAFKGITVPGYPNLFMLYGPNTNIVVGTSILFFSECQVRYAMLGIGALLRAGRRALEPRAEAFEAWNARVDAGNAAMAWGAAGFTSWYRNAVGHVTQNWPGTHAEYRAETLRFDTADYAMR